MDQSLPAPTRALIAVSEFLKASWWMLLGAGVLLLAGLRHFGRTQQGAYRLDKAVLKIPLAGNLKTKLAVARFSRTLGSLLENGVPLMAALDIVKNIVGNRVIAEAVQAAAAEVEKGAGLGKSLESSRFFPHLAVQMIQVGENSGELEAMLAKMADIYENEVETTVSGLTSMLEPAIILVMALVVGFIVLSIILPIFEMNQMIG
jgi:general secretion pathway protein F